MLTVLMVAEKPSISLALTQALATTPSTKRKGVSPSSPVYEYDGWFQGRPAHFKVTSTVGHMWSLDFPSAGQTPFKDIPRPLVSSRLGQTLNLLFRPHRWTLNGINNRISETKTFVRRTAKSAHKNSVTSGEVGGN